MMDTPKPEKISCRNKILAAAAEVFANQGVKGATTREIAKAAGVNETTLFRNFQTKEALLKAVVECNADEMIHNCEAPQIWTGDLKSDLTRFAMAYSQMIQEKEALVRMIIGEAKRQPDEAKLVIQNAAKPLRKKWIDYLTTLQKEGHIRPGIQMDQTVDAFTGMILSSLLRQGIMENQYQHKDYLHNCVELFIHGLTFSSKSD